MDKMTEKRTYNSGTIEDLGDGKYRLRVRAGKGVGTNYQRYSKTIKAKSRKEAERALAAFVRELEGKTAESMTLSGLIDEYTEAHVTKLAVKTQSWYSDTFRRIKAGLGHFKLRDLEPKLIRKFYDRLRDPHSKELDGLKNGISAESVKHHHRALSAALNWGYKQGYIDFKVMDRVSAPRTDTKEKRALSEGEIRAFLDVLSKESTHWQCFGQLALTTGMRRGEMLGLRWDDVDLKERLIHVRYTLQRIDGKFVLGEPKTGSSKRDIAITPKTYQLLQAWRKEQAEERMKFPSAWKDDYVFTRDDGLPRDTSAVSHKIQGLYKQAGIENATLHTLRHTFVTRLLAAGIPVHDVAASAGHASTQMTNDVYGHASETYAKRVGRAAAKILDIGPR